MLTGRRPGRHLPELGDVEIAVQPEGQRAGNRRRRHVQGVRAVRLGELGALLDAEAVLLVHDRDEEPVELDPVLEQGVRPDRDGSVAGRQALQPGAALRSGDVSGHELDRQPDRLEQRTKGRGVLLGQRLGGSHHRALTAGLDGTHERVCGDDRLARAHVPEQEPSHRTCAAEVPLELGDHPALATREGERQACVVAAGELARRGQGHCRRGGVELAPATQQRELEQQELLVREPAAGGPRLILVARRVQGRERVAAERKVTGHAKRRRQRLGHRVETVQVPHGEVVQQAAGKRARRVVDRDDAERCAGPRRLRPPAARARAPRSRARARPHAPLRAPAPATPARAPVRGGAG